MKYTKKIKARQKKFQMNKKSFIFLLILCLGVGFAFLSTQLTITGNTSVSGNKWSIYFNNVQVNKASVDASVVPTTTGTTTTSLNYTVLLDKPGDFYEFTVDAVNAGTIDAMIESITTPNIDSRVLQYVNYTTTYLDGTEINQNDVLRATQTTTYKVRVEYKKDIEVTDLPEDDINLTLTFEVNYVQSTIEDSAFVKMVKSSVLSDGSIDFTKISSDSNGKGLYLRSGTESSNFPIYYYRGAVTNNNAKFAGFCWKIVRTTETGGTKLIYNGTPNANGECVNTTGEVTQLSTKSGINPDFNSPAYTGYMYGKVYSEKKKSNINSSNYSYGNNFQFVDVNPNVSGDGTYTLTDLVTDRSQMSTHHYTCFNESGTCSELYYIYYLNGTTAYYVSLKDGNSIEDAFTEMHTNTNNSNVKKVLDNWFANTFIPYFTNIEKDYNDYLEDTIWCNDRGINSYGGWNPNGGSVYSLLSYDPYKRMQMGTPSLVCPNINDSFTVDDLVAGNGKLTYPIGLLTSDEVILAGGTEASNSSYYLYTNQYWWTMSPRDISDYWTSYVRGYGVGVALGFINVDTSVGVRPSISLKPEVKVAKGGDGTSAKPYEFVVE